jgi:hypothetical protein
VKNFENLEHIGQVDKNEKKNGNIIFYLMFFFVFFVFFKRIFIDELGSRNLTGPKTLPTIWYTYMTLVTKYQISTINSY